MDIIEHLLSRNLDPFEYQPALTTNTATFNLYTFNGEYAGYQQYRPEGSKTVRKNPRLGKYFTYMSKPAVWGLDFLTPTNYLIVCEGIFKAVRFHNVNMPAIATFSNNPVQLKEQLYLLSLTIKVIVVPDPDKAGKKLIKYSKHHVVPNKPIDDMTEEEFKEFADKIREYYANTCNRR